ncbi:PREDICTED: high mobility group protein B1-like isoform X1 [Branchiostoma belcheri]|uniref:High mobility group protein B1-like isoform X1 n=1 Tax=Branchiostoma belcheri TaxID=7741 RepID=A0A6P5A064_BRABE|nr:PREDICTED: high mobility group protein B1-like isoform X1 [Branchiostoma belcheri]
MSRMPTTTHGSKNSFPPGRDDQDRYRFSPEYKYGRVPKTATEGKLLRTRGKEPSRKLHKRSTTAPEHDSILRSQSVPPDDGAGETHGRYTDPASYLMKDSYHMSYQIPSFPYSLTSQPWSRRRAFTCPPSMKKNYYLQHPDLNWGQRQYLWSTAAVYSTSHMKRLIQGRYEQFLRHQQKMGHINKKELEKYRSYLFATRKTMPGVVDPGLWRSRPQTQMARAKSSNGDAELSRKSAPARNGHPRRHSAQRETPPKSPSPDEDLSQSFNSIKLEPKPRDQSKKEEPKAKPSPQKEEKDHSEEESEEKETSEEKEEVEEKEKEEKEEDDENSDDARLLEPPGDNMSVSSREMWVPWIANGVPEY